MSVPSAPALGDLARRAGIERIHVLGWRDLADVEAGGSELHLHEVARRWAAAGLAVTVRTSAAAGRAPLEQRAGYDVIRRGGRMSVFPRAALAELTGRHGPRRDALVEIWNGVPWFSPVWARAPRLIWLHHVHGAMWDQIFPPPIARAGRFLEARLAPPLYRRDRVVTLAESSRRELIDELGFSPDRVDVVPPGIDSRYSPGAARTAHPSIVAVGRLVPVKRFELLIGAVGELAGAVPGLSLTIVGEGYERERLEALITTLGLAGTVRLAGRVGDDELLALYRESWVIAASSLAEGWGMTLTEAAACATPAVVTDIVGHRDAVRDGVSGVLVDSRGGATALAHGLSRILTDDAWRNRLAAGAQARAAELTWDATAWRTLVALAEEAERCRR